MLALAGACAGEQRRGHRLGCGHGGELVRQDCADEARARIVRPALDRGEARGGLDDGVVDALGGIGAALAEAVDRDIDDGGIDGAHCRLAHTQALHHARPEVLDEHVGVSGEPEDHLAPLRVLQIDGDRALVAVVVDEVGGEPAGAVAAGAHVIAAAGGLHLDHVRALIAQHHGRERARDHGGQVDHAIAVERSRHGRSPLRSAGRSYRPPASRASWADRPPVVRRAAI